MLRKLDLISASIGVLLLLISLFIKNIQLSFVGILFVGISNIIETINRPTLHNILFSIAFIIAMFLFIYTTTKFDGSLS